MAPAHESINRHQICVDRIFLQAAPGLLSGLVGASLGRQLGLTTRGEEPFRSELTL